MVRTVPSLGVLERAIRMRVCAHCRQRPPHSESLAPEVVRPCEQDCPVFTHLPGPRKAAILTDPMLGSREAALRRWIDEICRRDAVGGGRPLSRYRAPILQTLLRLYGET